MKREFLQNFKIGDQSMPKEVIDSILDENGRDLEALKASNEALKDRLKTAEDGLKAFEGVDVSQLQGEIAKLKGDLAQKDTDWQNKLDGMAFDGRVKEAITAAKGRNSKAIAALLDVDTLRSSKNQEADIKSALEALKKDSAYLFEVDTPPGYASGTGTQQQQGNTGASSLLGALQEKYKNGKD